MTVEVVETVQLCLFRFPLNAFENPCDRYEKTLHSFKYLKIANVRVGNIIFIEKVPPKEISET